MRIADGALLAPTGAANPLLLRRENVQQPQLLQLFADQITSGGGLDSNCAFAVEKPVVTVQFGARVGLQSNRRVTQLAIRLHREIHAGTPDDGLHAVPMLDKQQLSLHTILELIDDPS